MKQIKDKGALLGAAALICIAMAGWMRADAGRSQQLTDLKAQVQQLQQDVTQIRGDLDRYLFVHDGH